MKQSESIPAGGDRKGMRLVRVLVNPSSDLPWSFAALRNALQEAWDVPGTDLSYQFMRSPEDGLEKAARAVAEGVDTILVAGGDGTVNVVGRVLVGTEVSLGVLPSGSGNGFARHMGIPLSPAKAARALAQASVKRIDVGLVEKTMFFITCSMAWDAAIVRTFQKSPFRGVLSYIFAGVNEFLLYKPQEISIELDTGEKIHFPDPLLFTVANMTQYGGGAKIAPHAREDDGVLELLVAAHRDVVKLVANTHKLFDGSANSLPNVVTRGFKSMKVIRKQQAQIQVDGDLVDMPAEMNVSIMPRALKVLVP